MASKVQRSRVQIQARMEYSDLKNHKIACFLLYTFLLVLFNLPFGESSLALKQEEKFDFHMYFLKEAKFSSETFDKFSSSLFRHI